MKEIHAVNTCVKFDELESYLKSKLSEENKKYDLKIKTITVDYTYSTVEVYFEEKQNSVKFYNL